MFYENRRFSGFSSFSGTLVRFSIKMKMILGLTFTKSLCLVLSRPAETSLLAFFHGGGGGGGGAPPEAVCPPENFCPP